MVADTFRPPYKAKAIANYFLAKAEKERIPMFPMKLQKLVYFAHGWHLGLYEKPLIDERIQAWEFGPVIRTLYDEFKEFGKEPIRRPAESLNYISERQFEVFTPEVPQEDTLTRALLDRVWDVYKTFSASQLSAMTHDTGSPWARTYPNNAGVRNLTIEDGVITDAFKKMANDNRQRRQPIVAS